MSNPAGSATAPAASYDPIFDVEGQVEAACSTVLALSRYNLPNIYTPRSTAQRSYPHAELKFTLGGETGHSYFLADGSNNWLPDAWRATLSVGFQSARKTAQTGMTAGTMRSRFRQSMQYFKAEFGPSVLLYHSLSQIIHQGSDQGFDAEKDVDWTNVTYAIVVSVRPGAWPTS